MGALHKGHESLIKKSVKESKKTLVSIFVNPKQFENKMDFNNYPKSYHKDIKILKKDLKLTMYINQVMKMYINLKQKIKYFSTNFQKNYVDNIEEIISKV